MTDLKTRRQYTDEEKARAVALAKEKGLTAASAALGVGKVTLWRWRAIAAHVKAEQHALCRVLVRGGPHLRRIVPDQILAILHGIIFGIRGRLRRRLGHRLGVETGLDQVRRRRQGGSGRVDARRGGGVFRQRGGKGPQFRLEFQVAQVSQVQDNITHGSTPSWGRVGHAASIPHRSGRRPQKAGLIPLEGHDASDGGLGLAAPLACVHFSARRSWLSFGGTRASHQKSRIL